MERECPEAARNVAVESRCCRPAAWSLRRSPEGAVWSEWPAAPAWVLLAQHPAPVGPFQRAGPSASPVRSAAQPSTVRQVSAQPSGQASSSDDPGAARRPEAAWLSEPCAVEATTAEVEEAVRSGATARPPGAAAVGPSAQQRVAQKPAVEVWASAEAVQPRAVAQ